MANLIAIILFLIGLSGMVAILFRKAPLLADLPANLGEKESLILRFKTKIKNFDFSQAFNLRNFLEKFLMRIRILTLKMENKTSQILEKMRQKEKKEIENNYKDDSYWKKLKRKIKK